MTEEDNGIEQSIAKAPRSIWVIGIAALLWNLLGVMAFVAHISVGEEALSQLPEAERALYEATPLWANIAYAVAVFGGVLGSIALLMRRTYAVLLFAISLLAVLVQMFQAFVLADAMAVLGPASLVMPVLVIVIAAALLAYARKARETGLLR